MKDDRTVSLKAAIDALDKVAEMFPYRIPGKAKTYRQYNEAWSDAIDAAENALEALPSAQPTLYGYDIKHLAFVATIMAKKGVSPEEAVAIFRDVNRVIEMMLEDMKEMQENALKQALKKPWEGRQDSDVQRDT